MKLVLALTGIVTLCFFIGCASSGPRILERADALGSTPEWARVTKPSFEENGKRYFLGYVELEGEVSKSGALNMADEKALSEPMRSLVDEFLDQNQVGESLRRESTFGQRIISATRGFRAPMPTLTIVKRYWEVAATGPYTTATRAYSLAEISIAEFERAKQEYFERLSGNSEMRQILRDVGKKQREKILGNSASTTKS